MYFHGSFLTQSGETVTVHIVIGNSRTQTVEIGSEESDIFFTDNPVEIESSVNDSFDHLLRSRASIRLLTRDFIPDFFCSSCMDAVVNIFKGDKCVFAGFIEPQAYSQSYNELYDELELSCIDALSALQYANYRNVGSLGVVYDSVKANAEQLSFGSIINNVFEDINAVLDITGGGIRYYYDGSKSLTETSGRYDIFSQIAISELLFLEEDEDDVWPLETVLETILKYLNLHIVQNGLDFFIFSWETVKGSSAIAWHDLAGGSNVVDPRVTVDITAQKVADMNTSISIGEVYNQISLTCRTKAVETLVENPMESDSLESPYSGRQKYMTEYSAEGEGRTAINAFFDMCMGRPTDYADGVITDWYIQIRNNPSWIFPKGNTDINLIDEFCTDNANQQALPNYLGTMGNVGNAAIISFGKVEEKTDHKDNAPVSKIDMKDYLAISVNGNGEDSLANTFPKDADLKDNSPLAIYAGATSGAVYSPSDPDVTNYIVMSGSIVLNPVMEFSANYKYLHNLGTYPKDVMPPYHWLVPSRDSDGRYYTQKYYTASTPYEPPVWEQKINRGLVPYTGSGPQEYEFKYSAVGDSTDKISKVGVLACMLIIGDKCVVETGTSGKVSDFVWKPYKTRQQCNGDDEYYQQSFTLGFDPKIGDFLIGTEFDIQNNIDYTLGLDVEGTAIPIRKSDKLSGEVKFIILGPVNTQWGEISRRHKTWFRSEKWNTDSIPLLAHVSAIYVKDFEVKLYSDNGFITPEDNDLVYLSDTKERFVNKKDDITFEITSALTLEECRKLAIPDNINLSTPLDVETGNGLLSIYDHNKGEQAKPEQLYVDSFYTEYHKPRIIMEQSLDDSPAVTYFNRYRHPAMPEKIFYVQGINRNLIESSTRLTLKEVWND